MNPIRMFLTLLAIGAAFSVNAGDVIGRVLIVQGKAEVQRASVPIAIVGGFALELKDLVRVGPESSVQLRMSDGSLIALRSNTELLIEDFRFKDTKGEDSSLLSLLRGGMRTITGLIGKRNPKGYAVHTAAATIGIRGTNFSALNCHADCFNPDGTTAPDGAYGGVTEGIIVVTNKIGAVEFEKDEYFYVAGDESPPARLLAPPSFLPDQLDGIARAGVAAQFAAASQTGALGQPSGTNTSGATGGNTSTDSSSPAGGSTGAAGGGASSSTAARSGSPIDASTNGAQEPPSAANVSADTTSSIASTTSPSPTTLAPPTVAVAVPVSYSPAATPAVQAGTVPISSAESFSEVLASATSTTTLAPCSGACGTTVTGSAQGLTAFTFSNANVLFPAGTSPAYVQLQSEPQLAAFTNATSYTVAASLSEGLTSGTETYTKTAATDTGTYTTADGQTAYWGRYQSTDVTTGAPAGSNNSNTQYTHWLVAPAILALPTAGIFTYNAVGGTHPTDTLGNVGVVNSAGAWTVNFSNNTFFSSAPVVWTMPRGVSYTLDVTQPQPYTVTPLGSNVTQIPSGGTETRSGSAVNVVNVTSFTTCTGGACALTFSQLQPLFGNRFLGLGITTNATTSTGQQTTAQVRVYGR